MCLGVVSDVYVHMVSVHVMCMRTCMHVCMALYAHAYVYLIKLFLLADSHLSCQFLSRATFFLPCAMVCVQACMRVWYVCKCMHVYVPSLPTSFLFNYITCNFLNPNTMQVPTSTYIVTT